MAAAALCVLLMTVVATTALSNIVYIMTDDQDIELGGLTPMPKTRELLGEQGAVGEAFYIATPICCPSRTETLSGRLYHNVLEDKLQGCMHVDQTKYIFNHSSSLFPQLQQAGYLTGGFGKIINGQQKQFKATPPITNGWDWLSAPMNEGDYFGAEHFEKRPNGSHWQSSLGKKEDVVNSWYQTAQIGNRSLEFIDYAVTVAKKPFVVYLGPHAPHYSADSPPWARELYTGMKAPRTPAYNTSQGQRDKTMHVRQNPGWEVNSEMERHIDIHFRDRWRAISGVDDMIGLVYDALEKHGILDDTYIFFSSDHGYKLGEWRLGCSKEHPYETDVHIPFFARGPGIAPGTRIKALGSNIDIAPTFIDIAGLSPNPEHDGSSLLPLLIKSSDDQANKEAQDSWRTRQIIEYLAVGTYFNDHAKLWLSGPAEQPGTPVKYGAGPFSREGSAVDEKHCASTEVAGAAVGSGQCSFVDSTASNNWIALRVRNQTSNFIYVESFGVQSTKHKTYHGDGIGIFKCVKGDLCQWELYDYGNITSDYPDFPVMTRERWNLDNLYSHQTDARKAALAVELKAEYCRTKRLEVDRMGCR